MDFIFAMIIFSICAVIFFSYLPNVQKQEFDLMNMVHFDGQMIAESLVFPGYPEDWTPTTVKYIGIVDGGSDINQTKLRHFDNLSRTDYLKTKTLLNVRSDFIIFFKEINGLYRNLSGISYIGKEVEGITPLGINTTALSPTTLTKYVRILVYENTPIEMEVYTWQ